MLHLHPAKHGKFIDRLVRFRRKKKSKFSLKKKLQKTFGGLKNKPHLCTPVKRENPESDLGEIKLENLLTIVLARYKAKLGSEA